MRINLKTEQSARQITSVRGQIKDPVALKNFDEFVNKNPEFNFNNDAHLQKLKKISNCDVDTTIHLDPGAL